MSRKSRERKQAASKGLFLDPMMSEVIQQLQEDQSRVIVRGEKGQFKSVKAEPPTVEMIAVLRSMTDVMLAPITAEQCVKPITWVIASNGIWHLRQTAYGLAQIKVGTSPVPLTQAQPIISTLNVPKLPWPLLEMIVSFLRWVHQTHQTEGLVRGYYDDAKELWTLHVPEQTVSGASVVISNDEPMDVGLGRFALEIHSHPGTSSVFSGTDDANEQRERIFGCVAGWGNSIPNFHWRLGTGVALWEDLDMADVVDTGKELVFKLTPMACLQGNMTFNPLRESVAFPEEWKEKVKLQSAGRVLYGSAAQAYGARVNDPSWGRYENSVDGKVHSYWGGN
jgi:hypothetical protein